MLEEKEGFRRGLATFMHLRRTPEGRNVLSVALPKHGSSVG